MANRSFKAFQVREEGDNFIQEIVNRSIDDLPDNDTLVRVKFAALNYKDALSATGHKGVTKNYPHTPGVDAVGVVESSKGNKYSEGDEVIVTSYDLGMNTSGGFAEYISVPAQWVVPKPKELTLAESMIFGTAGFTAGLSIFKMEQNGQKPENGPILVTGASGGVGSMAVSVLAKAGYEVIASTGKPEAYNYLEQLGASRCISREEVNDQSGRPLLKPQWAGAIDTVGGNTLTIAIKACQKHGNVAACGLVGNNSFESTIYPFIIKGVNLLGIETATHPMPERILVWEKLANEWKIDHFDQIGEFIKLEELSENIDKILAGKISGRKVVTL